MNYNDPKEIDRDAQYHSKLRSGTIKCVHGSDDSANQNKIYCSSFYDVYVKANNAEEDIHLKRVPADPELPRLYEGQGVMLYYVEWNQKPLIIGANASGKVDVVDLTKPNVVLGPMWWQFHRARGFTRMVPNPIIIEKEKVAKFVEYWDKTITLY